MTTRFAFFYLFKEGTAQAVEKAVPDHVSYWKELAPEYYRGGPFADRSGGMIVFSAGDPIEAARIAMGDPFVLEDLHEVRWIKEWVLKP